jgi:hypothetical protein
MPIGDGTPRQICLIAQICRPRALAICAACLAGSPSAVQAFGTVREGRLAWCAKLLGRLVREEGDVMASDDLNERALHRRAVEAAVWGMPAVNYQSQLFLSDEDRIRDAVEAASRVTDVSRAGDAAL